MLDQGGSDAVLPQQSEVIRRQRVFVADLRVNLDPVTLSLNPR